MTAEEIAYRGKLREYDQALDKCLIAWKWYLKYSRESAEAAQRASEYYGNAASGYQQALNAAQAELDSMVPDMPSLPSNLGEAAAWGIDQATNGLSSAVQGILERQARAMDALLGLQGGQIGETMGAIAMRNSSDYWKQALAMLSEYRRDCPPKPPTRPSPDFPPWPTDKEPRKGDWSKLPYKDTNLPPPLRNPDGRSLAEVATKLKHADPHVARRAARVIAQSNLAPALPPTVETIRSALSSPDVYVRFWSAVAFRKLGVRGKIAESELVALTRDHDVLVRAQAIQALHAAQLTGSAAVQAAPARRIPIRRSASWRARARRLLLRLLRVGGRRRHLRPPRRRRGSPRRRRRRALAESGSTGAPSPDRNVVVRDRSGSGASELRRAPPDWHPSCSSFAMRMSSGRLVKEAQRGLAVAAILASASDASAETPPTPLVVPCGPTAMAPPNRPWPGTKEVVVPANTPALAFRVDQAGGQVGRVGLGTKDGEPVATTWENTPEGIVLRLGEALVPEKTYVVEATTTCSPDAGPPESPVLRFVATNEWPRPKTIGKVTQEAVEIMRGLPTPVLVLEPSLEALRFLPVTRFEVRAAGDDRPRLGAAYGALNGTVSSPKVDLGQLSVLCAEPSPSSVTVSALLAGEASPYATQEVAIDIAAFCEEQARRVADGPRASEQPASGSSDGCAVVASGAGASAGPGALALAGLAVVVARRRPRRPSVAVSAR